MFLRDIIVLSLFYFSLILITAAKAKEALALSS